jgi:uncharacterized protein (TIGR02058 family)
MAGMGKGRRAIHSLRALIDQAKTAAPTKRPMLVQCGFGETGEREGMSLGAARHGRSCHAAGDHANTAAVRACRNALGFNTSPAGRIDHYLRCYPQELEGLKERILIHVKLGVPEGYTVDFESIRHEFPYGRLLPLETVTGGLTYSSGAPEDESGNTVVVVAAVSIGAPEPPRPTAP